MEKIADIVGVRIPQSVDDDVSLCRDDESGRLVIVVSDGCTARAIDAFDLAFWMDGPGAKFLHDHRSDAAAPMVAAPASDDGS